MKKHVVPQLEFSQAAIHTGRRWGDKHAYQFRTLDPVLIPVGTKHVSLVVDHSACVGDDHCVHAELELSLDGGKTWGGAFVDSVAVPPMSYPLTIAAAGGPVSTPAPPDMRTELMRGTDVPPDQGHGVWARPCIGLKSEAAIKVSLEFD